MAGYVRTFNRFELKYLLHFKQAREFLDGIRAHVTLDENAGREGFYKVASVYYDSPNLMCYWEKVDGEKYRRKVRVRTYGEMPTEAFPEIKQRYNLTVQKRRCRGEITEVERRMESILRGDCETGLDPVYDEIFFLVHRYNLEPKTLVSYNRMALFDLYKKDLRITIDRNVRARAISLGLREHRLRGRHAIPPTLMIVEVKFNEFIPRWLCSVLNRYDAQIQRVSKYCLAVEALNLDRRISLVSSGARAQHWKA